MTDSGPLLRVGVVLAVASGVPVTVPGVVAVALVVPGVVAAEPGVVAAVRTRGVPLAEVMPRMAGRAGRVVVVARAEPTHSTAEALDTTGRAEVTETDERELASSAQQS